MCAGGNYDRKVGCCDSCLALTKEKPLLAGKLKNYLVQLLTVNFIRKPVTRYESERTSIVSFD